MSLTSRQTQFIAESYALIRRDSRDYSNLFYHRLLHRHPFARVLFPDDITQQVETFRQTIDVLVDQVNNFSVLQPTLAALAQRHLEYGVKAQHYAIVGEVLIDSFAEILADRFTPAMREAWEELYAMTAGVMVTVAYPDEPPRGIQ